MSLARYSQPGSTARKYVRFNEVPETTGEPIGSDRITIENGIHAVPYVLALVRRKKMK